MTRKREAHRNKSSLLKSVLVLSLMTVSITTAAGVNERERAKFIHDRLAGTLATDAMLDLMEASLVAGNTEEAARLAIDGNRNKGDLYQGTIASSGGFYNATLKNWATPWTNEAQDVFQPLNDYSATVIGLVRDDRDFSELLSQDIIYLGHQANLNSDLGISVDAYSIDNNNHYEQLEQSSADLGNPNYLVDSQQSSVTGIPAAGVAGVMTTRAAARAFFIDGTNRAMFRFTVLNHLCNDLEQYKDNELPTDRIRRDISRSPGGDSSIYLNECSACHTGLDPMSQAFAYHQYEYPSEAQQPGRTEEERKEMGRLVYTPGLVQDKLNINAGNFPAGFIAQNDHWVNYWRTGPNAQKIGWLPTEASSALDEAINPAYSEGDGMAMLGKELANSNAFAYCQVKKAFQTVCLREPEQSADGAAVESIVSAFKSGYDMKKAFVDVAVHCSAHLIP